MCLKLDIFFLAVQLLEAVLCNRFNSLPQSLLNTNTYSFQRYNDWKDGLPDLKWLDEVMPDNEKWQHWRGNLIEFKDSLKDNIEIGGPSYFKVVTPTNNFFTDPKLKALSEAKYKQFRSWFDQRLDDAIAAAEQQNNSLPPAIEGKNTSDNMSYISEYTLLMFFLFYFFSLIQVYSPIFPKY